MRSLVPLLFLTASLTCLCVVAASPADEGKIEEGYVALFNGKDLSGWRYGKKGRTALEGKTETPDRRFKVKDGAIVA